MEEKIRRDVAALFGEDYISLDSLDNVNPGILDRPVHVSRQKCPHLSPLINCNVGGFAHMGCTDPNFHEHCKFRAAHEKRERSRQGR